MGTPTHNPWVLSVFDELLKVTDDQSKSFIYRVPPYLRMVKPERYNYSILPLGLYNRDFRNVAAVDQLKLEVVSAFLKHLKLRERNLWNKFCNEVAEPPSGAPALENSFDNAPNESFITPEVVRVMLTIDAVFITGLLLLRFALTGGIFSNNDYAGVCRNVWPIFKRGGVWCHFLPFMHDILLLENQIPLFLIKNVWGKISDQPADIPFDPFLENIIVGILRPLHLPCAESHFSSLQSCDHLLACVHELVCQETHINPSSDAGYFEVYVRKLVDAICRPCSGGHVHTLVAKLGKVLKFAKKSKIKSSGRRSLPSVSQLRRAGIHIRGIQTSASNISFVKSPLNLKATLYLPKIDFQDFSEKILLNMCVYELMIPGAKKLIAYMQVMDELINTEEDVELLRRGDEPVVTINLLGEDKVIADLFNNPLQNFSFNDGDFNHLLKVFDDIHAWYGTRWRHQLTRFLEIFRIEPWILVTSIAATLLLVATILQTVYSLLQFYQR